MGVARNLIKYFLVHLYLWETLVLVHAFSGHEDSSPDFLENNIVVYIIIVLGLFTFQTVVIILMGQPLISPNGIKLWYGDSHGPENSQQIADWYTFTHIIHGFLMYFLTLYLLPLIPLHILDVGVNWGYIIALCSAVIYEILENTSCVINRFRKTGASAEYYGDSVLNSSCDTIFMSGGFWAAYFMGPITTGVLILAEEVVLGVVIRDNFIINCIQLVFSFKFISEWQSRGNLVPVPRQDPENGTQQQE